jgi:hypothetical protein
MIIWGGRWPICANQRFCSGSDYESNLKGAGVPMFNYRKNRLFFFNKAIKIARFKTRVMMLTVLAKGGTLSGQSCPNNTMEFSKIMNTSIRFFFIQMNGILV